MTKGVAMSFTAALQTAQLLKESEICGKKQTLIVQLCVFHRKVQVLVLYASNSKSSMKHRNQKHLIWQTEF